MSKKCVPIDAVALLKERGLTEADHEAVLPYVDKENITVLKAELNSGAFCFVLNSNPDNLTKIYHPNYKNHAEFFAHKHIHPDDRHRFFQEIQFWHNKHFGCDLKRHSVYSRVLDIVTGKYKLYEFTTLRAEICSAIEKNIILICQPIDYEF